MDLLLRQRPYPMRGHRLLSIHVVICTPACIDQQVSIHTYEYALLVTQTPPQYRWTPCLQSLSRQRDAQSGRACYCCIRLTVSLQLWQSASVQGSCMSEDLTIRLFLTAAVTNLPSGSISQRQTFTIVLLTAGTPLSELSTRAAMVTTMQAMAAVTANSTPLPGPCYDLCFPVLEAVLSSSVHTPLHEQALQVMALHVAPGLPLPRKDTLAVLFHVLGVVPAYRYDLQTYATLHTALLLLSSQTICAVTSLRTLSNGGSLYMSVGCRHAENFPALWS